MMRSVLKRMLAAVFLDEIMRELVGSFRRFFKLLLWATRRGFGAVDRKIVKRHFAENPTRKLHLGCGHNILPGWVNSDLFPTSREIVHVDATKRFPFADGTFDYIFSEHIIEHFTYGDGQRMLGECHRVLKKGGKIRVSTPDLAFLIALYAPEKSDLQKQYVIWSTKHHIPDAPGDVDTHVINNFVRDWGHKFIYDEKTLLAALARAGFTDVVKRALNESDHAALRDLENVSRMPDGFLALESITMEATKE